MEFHFSSSKKVLENRLRFTLVQALGQLSALRSEKLNDFKVQNPKKKSLVLILRRLNKKSLQFGDIPYDEIENI